MWDALFSLIFPVNWFSRRAVQDAILNGEYSRLRLAQVYAIGSGLSRREGDNFTRVVDRNTGRAYACKTVKKCHLRHKDDIRDLKNEIALLHQVTGHLNVESIHRVYEDDSSVHMVVSLCEGGELFDMIKKMGCLSEKDAIPLFKQMVKAVRHCHENNVMHRNIKPENFLVASSKDETQRVVLIDFSTALKYKNGQVLKQISGSPYYVAPEVLRKSYTISADLWSLGVCLYVMLSGYPPFYGKNEAQIFEQILKKPLRFDGQPWPSVSEEAKNLIRRLCDRNSKQRITAEQTLQHPWLRREKDDYAGFFERTQLPVEEAPGPVTRLRSWKR